MKIFELNIKIPPEDETLGVPREEMPQIEREDYNDLFRYLKNHGISVTATGKRADTLKPIQGEFSARGVEKALTKRHIVKPIIVSKDNFLIDGHHRWLAQMNIDGSELVPVIKADALVSDLLPLVMKFPKTTFKKLY